MSLSTRSITQPGEHARQRGKDSGMGLSAVRKIQVELTVEVLGTRITNTNIDMFNYQRTC